MSQNHKKNLTMNEQLLKTPCHDWHVQNGGRMVDFAGWSMPVQYSSIAEEHKTVRHDAGLFDIAHMGRLYFQGPGAVPFLDALVTCDVSALELGQIRYGLIANQKGGILDDVLVYHFPDGFLLVVNASNRTKILDWIRSVQIEHEFELRDDTQTSAMLALQGPQCVEILDAVTLPELDLHGLEYYTGLETEVLGESAIISRTGYTGEDGFEIIIAAEKGMELWEALMEKGKPHGLKPAGLGCRDTLRLEAGMPLYGHELSEEIDPFSAGLSFAVNLDKEQLIGRKALTERKENFTKKRIGLELEGRRIAREGSKIFSEGEEVGEVTSGTFSPSLEKPIAMGYVNKELAKAGTVFEVEIRGQRLPAYAVKLPFYRREH